MIACPHSWINIKPTIPQAYGQPKNREYVAEVINIEISGPALVILRAASKNFVLPNKYDAPRPNVAIVPPSDLIYCY